MYGRGDVKVFRVFNSYEGDSMVVIFRLSLRYSFRSALCDLRRSILASMDLQ